MLPDRVLNPGPLTYESGALPIALRGPASGERSHPKKRSTLEGKNLKEAYETEFPLKTNPS